MVAHFITAIPSGNNPFTLSFIGKSKRPEWSDEEEVRLIGTRGIEPQVKIEPQWLTRIILGKNMSDGNRQQIRVWAKQREPELLVVSVFFDKLHQEIRLRE
jgi:hypothetical protein